jgi:RNA polymerase primary sigma factor
MAYNLNLMDLVAEGTIGLMKAIDKFDPGKEIHFISYAVWWIRQAIFDYLNKTHSLIYIPSNILKKIRKEDYLKGLQNDPKNRVKLTLIRNSFMKVLRFHDPVESDRDDDEFINHIPAETKFAPDKLLQKDHLRNKIGILLGSLDAKERKILEMRYGLGGFNRKMSLKEISRSFRLTKERIRQIQNKALGKLKKLYKVHNLSTFLTEH